MDLNGPTGRTIAVFHQGASYPRLEAWAVEGGSPLKVLVRKAATFLSNQRNPRNFSYMEALAKERFPELEQVIQAGSAGQLPEMEWGTVKRMVLLWPDATGVGWRRVEAGCVRRRGPGTSISVLNGRRRQFEFDSAACRKLQSRRLLETSLMFQGLFTILILAGAPCLWLADLLRGKR